MAKPPTRIKGDKTREGYSPRGWGSCRLLQHLPILDPVLDAPLSILILRAFYTDACPEESLHLVNSGWYGGGDGFRFDFYHHFLLSIACLLNIAHLQGEPEISAMITPRRYNAPRLFFFKGGKMLCHNSLLEGPLRNEVASTQMFCLRFFPPPSFFNLYYWIRFIVFLFFFFNNTEAMKGACY